MKLRYSPTSPYVRKVTVTAIELDLENQIERVATNPWDPASDIGENNPLGKVPTLILDDGRNLFDSPVICEYLGSLQKQSELLPSGEKRWEVLRQQALADGILDAAILLFLENGKREAPHRSQWWMDLQMQAITQSITELEKIAPDFDEQVDLGQIATGCALGYLDFRFGDLNWRSEAPTLADWYGRFSQRRSMQETTPQDPK